MDPSRARILGLLGLLAGFGVDHGLTLAAEPLLPVLVEAVAGAGAASPEEAAALAATLLGEFGWFLGAGVGLVCTFLGAVVTAAVAPRHRVGFAMGEGLLSASVGLPMTMAALAAGGLRNEGLAWVVLLLLTVVVAVVGGGLVALVARALRDEPRPGAPGPARPAPVEPAAAALPPAPVPGTPAPAGTFRAAFHGDGADLFRIHVVNMLLTFVTFGVYKFWARVKVRRYLYSHTEFEGDRFAFHGTGTEAFRGWLKGTLYVGLPLAGIRFAERFVSIGDALLLQLLAMLVLAVVVPIAIAGAWRYRLSRTGWRGLRFSFRGRPREALEMWLSSLLLTVLSLGVCFPLLQVNLHRFLTRHAYYGTRRFGFDGRGGDLVRGWVLRFLLPAGPIGVLTFVLFVPTFGLSFFVGGLALMRLWYGYSAYKTHYLMAHTSFDAARFRSTVTGLGLFGLHLLNFLLVAGTFGLGIPWAQVRTQQYALANLVLDGPLDLAGIQQEAQQASVTGEGIADVLDADAIDIGVGV